MVLALATGVMAGACSSGSADPATPDEGTVVDPAPDDAIVAAAGEATWRVETDGCSWLGSGSAFAIDARHLVTNWHVIANDTSPLVRSRQGRVLPGRVVGATERPDVAVIEVTEDLGATVAFAPAEGVDEGEHLVVLGYPSPAQRFTVSTGSVVSFHGPDREAILTDAPVAPGSSGGPALRTDGSVAGVVTQMTLDDPREHVAIALTAATIDPVIEAALTAPVEVLSTCGLGPDYVPPAPAAYDIAAPPPPAADTETVVDAGPSTVPSAPTVPPVTDAPPGPQSTPPPRAVPTTMACPAGQVTASLDSFEAAPVSGEPDWYDVSARGTVTNATDEPVHVSRVVAVVAGDPPQDVVGFPDTTNVLPPQGSDTWTAQGPARTSRSPATAQVRVEWTFDDPALARCTP